MREQNQPSWCEELYRQKAAQLILYGRALGLSHSESEDIVQETFIALLKLERRPETPEHYLFRALRNRAFNFKRSLWRQLQREVESFRWFEQNSAETAEERAAMRCLEKLPREQREVIVLKIWSACTFEQIAQMLDLSPNTVAGRYRYGLEKLRNCLKGKDYERLELDRTAYGPVDSAPAIA